MYSINRSRTSTATILLTLLLGILVVFATLANFNFSSNIKGITTSAATVQTHRRLYVYKNSGLWTTNTELYIYYFGGSGYTELPGSPDSAKYPQMTRVLSTYHGGLYYYDMPIGATDFNIRRYANNTIDESNRTISTKIANLFVDGDYQAAEILVNSGRKEFSVKNNLPIGNTSIASVLSHIDSCSSCYASGYNAWPQINVLFIQPSSFDGTTVVSDNFGPSTTIDDKIAYLERQYNIDQGL